MAYLNGVADAGKSAPNPASPALGNIPSQQLPPPPTGAEAMPTGSPTRTKTTVGGEAIAALRDLQGYTPNLFQRHKRFHRPDQERDQAKAGRESRAQPLSEHRACLERRN